MRRRRENQHENTCRLLSALSELGCSYVRLCFGSKWTRWGHSAHLCKSKDTRLYRETEPFALQAFVGGISWQKRKIMIQSNVKMVFGNVKPLLSTVCLRGDALGIACRPASRGCSSQCILQVCRGCWIRNEERATCGATASGFARAPKTHSQGLTALQPGAFWEGSWSDMSNNFRAVESLRPVLKSLRPENEKTHRLRLGDPNILSERFVVRRISHVWHSLVII